MGCSCTVSIVSASLKGCIYNNVGVLPEVVLSVAWFPRSIKQHHSPSLWGDDTMLRTDAGNVITNSSPSSVGCLIRLSRKPLQMASSISPTRRSLTQHLTLSRTRENRKKTTRSNSPVPPPRASPFFSIRAPLCPRGTVAGGSPVVFAGKDFEIPRAAFPRVGHGHVSHNRHDRPIPFRLFNICRWDEGNFLTTLRCLRLFSREFQFPKPSSLSSTDNRVRDVESTDQ